MKHIYNYEVFLEDNNNPNTPQGYINSLSNKSKIKPVQNNNNQKPNNQKPTDDVDNILQNTEQQKQNIVAKKDVIEKGLLQNIQDLEPENQKQVKTQVQDYKTQVQEFDKTVQQIDKLNQTLKKSNVKQNSNINMKTVRTQNNF